MKKILIILSILLLVGCTNKPNDLNNLISYDIPNTYQGNEITDENNIHYETDYISSKNDSKLFVEIFSYKNISPINGEILNENEYIRALKDKSELTVDNETITVGYSDFNEIDKEVLRAFVRKNDYVFEFSIQGKNDLLTEDEKNDFMDIIKTINFK